MKEEELGGVDFFTNEGEGVEVSSRSKDKGGFSFAGMLNNVMGKTNKMFAFTTAEKPSPSPKPAPKSDQFDCIRAKLNHTLKL